jgi:hypothetical protein
MTEAITYGSVEGLPAGADIPPVDEDIFLENAISGGAWTASRIVIGGLAFLFGKLVFTYIYQRTINAHGLWRLPGQQPSLYLGVAVLVCVLGSTGVHAFGLRRLRSQGLGLDWRVAAGIALFLGLLGAFLQGWEMGRLHFQPGSSAFAGVFVGWQPVFILVLLGSMYWLETLIARSLRVRWVLRPGQVSDGKALPLEITRFRASIDSYSFFSVFVAGIAVLGFALFYL